MTQALTVKHWGIWPISRGRYLAALGIQVFSLAALFGVWWLQPGRWPQPLPTDDACTVFLLGLGVNMGWLLLAFVAWTVLDAGLMLRRFHQQARGRA